MRMKLHSLEYHRFCVLVALYLGQVVVELVLEVVGRAHLCWSLGWSSHSGNHGTNVQIHDIVDNVAGQDVVCLSVHLSGSLTFLLLPFSLSFLLPLFPLPFPRPWPRPWSPPLAQDHCCVGVVGKVQHLQDSLSCPRFLMLSHSPKWLHAIGCMLFHLHGQL